jgi:hypothetical protein
MNYLPRLSAGIVRVGGAVPMTCRGRVTAAQARRPSALVGIRDDEDGGPVPTCTDCLPDPDCEFGRSCCREFDPGHGWFESCTCCAGPPEVCEECLCEKVCTRHDGSQITRSCRTPCPPPGPCCQVRRR